VSVSVSVPVPVPDPSVTPPEHKRLTADRFATGVSEVGLRVALASCRTGVRLRARARARSRIRIRIRIRVGSGC